MSPEKDGVPGKDKAHLNLFISRLPFLPFLAAMLLRLLHRSCHFTILGQEHEEALIASVGPKIVTCWHFAFPAVIYRYRDLNIVTMVSGSRDGELATRVLDHFGVRCFRGSSGKGGSKALLGLIDTLGSAIGGGFIADGSQGPPRIAQKGILLLARYTGAPILPMSMPQAPAGGFGAGTAPCWSNPFPGSSWPTGLSSGSNGMPPREGLRN